MHTRLSCFFLVALKRFYFVVFCTFWRRICDNSYLCSIVSSGCFLRFLSLCSVICLWCELWVFVNVCLCLFFLRFLELLGITSCYFSTNVNRLSHYFVQCCHRFCFHASVEHRRLLILSVPQITETAEFFWDYPSLYHCLEMVDRKMEGSFICCSFGEIFWDHSFVWLLFSVRK